MSGTDNVRIFHDDESGIVFECYDTEMSDQFDDFLVQNVDQEIYLRFEGGRILFIFGRSSSIEEVCDLYRRFAEVRT
jgi:hypothetical protein